MWDQQLTVKGVNDEEKVDRRVSSVDAKAESRAFMEDSRADRRSENADVVSFTRSKNPWSNSIAVSWLKTRS
jgi:hypothetical protein